MDWNRIWQTAAEAIVPNGFPGWKSQPGFEHTYIDDEGANLWAEEKLAGSDLLRTWKHLPSEALVR